MKKNVLLIFLFLFLLFPLACKSPETPELPTKTQDVVEFMYKRTKPILDNNATGPLSFTVWSSGGGWNIKRLTYLGNDQWVGAKALAYSKSPYWINTVDLKVMGGVWGYVAETFYARIQGSSEWVKLTCVEVEPGTAEIAAKFYLDDGAIIVP